MEITELETSKQELNVSYKQSPKKPASHSTDIQIGPSDAIKALNGNYLEYRVWRPTLFFIVSPLMFSLCFLVEPLYKSPASWIISISLVGCAIFNIVLHQFRSIETGCKFQTFTQLKATMNRFFGIPNWDKLSAYDRKYVMNMEWHGLELMFLTMYTGVTMFVLLYSYSGVCDYSKGSASRSHGQCLIETVTTPAYLLAYGVLVLLYCPPKVNDETLKAIQEQRQDVLTRYKHTRINEFADRVGSELDRWIVSKQLSSRKLECVVLFLFSAVFFEYGGFIFDFENHVWNNASELEIVWAIIVSICNTLLLTIGFYRVNTFAVYHWCYPKRMMAVLNEAIYCDSMEDLVSLWELRNYYIDCDIMIRKQKFAPMLFIGLFGSGVASLIFIVYGVLEGDYRAMSVTGAIVLYMLIVVVIACQNAVNFHNLQFEHVRVFNRETLRMKRKKIEFDSDLIGMIKEDIEKNTKPIIMGGVALNNTFMILVRTYVIAVISMALTIINIMY